MLVDSTGRVTGAVWTGTLAPERFVEFPFVAVNPPKNTRLIWPTYQTYADGERVEWTGPVDAKQPASVTEIQASGVLAGPGWAIYLSVGALVLGLVSLGLSLQKRE